MLPIPRNTEYLGDSLGRMINPLPHLPPSRLSPCRQDALPVIPAFPFVARSLNTRKLHQRFSNTDLIPAGLLVLAKHSHALIIKGMYTWYFFYKL